MGCGPGGFGPTLRQTLGSQARLVGVESTTAAADRARTDHGYDEVVEGYFPEALGDHEERFDLVCHNDVLEHVVDPWQMLRETRRWLTPQGQVLALIPSIQFVPVVWRLIRGRWDYADTGTLDRSHLRFFTRATMIEMFEQNGYRIELCEGVNAIEVAWRIEPRLPKRLAKTALLPFLGDSRFSHFALLAKPL